MTAVRFIELSSDDINMQQFLKPHTSIDDLFALLSIQLMIEILWQLMLLERSQWTKNTTNPESNAVLHRCSISSILCVVEVCGKSCNVEQVLYYIHSSLCSLLFIAFKVII